ncbi:hypothetical protein EIN_055370, partial [Entamoeba invadens IP1]|uniref:hypothetical protein n=1 Tax=Entamoeba invadens IP1 TaxID=370355 RepID=UPI0002C3E21E
MFGVIEAPSEEPTIRPNPYVKFLKNLPKRPEFGPSLQKVTLQTNIFRVNFDELRIYSYKANFYPNTTNSGMKRGLLTAHFKYNNRIFTDGWTVWTTQKIGEDAVTFRIVSQQKMAYTVDLIEIVTTAFNIQKGNVLLKSIFVEGNKNMVSWKKSFFDNEQTRILETPDGQLDIKKGFCSTIRIFEDCSYIIVDTSFKVFQAKSYLESIEGKAADQIEMQFKPSSLFNKITKKMVHVDKIDFDKTPNYQFACKGKMMSIADYYLTKYNKVVTRMDQPLLAQRNKLYRKPPVFDTTNVFIQPQHIQQSDRIEEGDKGQHESFNYTQNEYSYFLPEFLALTGLSEKMEKDKQLNTRLREIFVQPPTDRLELILEYVKRYVSSLEGLKHWGITIDTRPTFISAYLLKMPVLEFKDKTATPNPANWLELVQNSFYVNPVEIKEWTAIIPMMYKDEFMTLQHLLLKYFTKIRVVFNPAKVVYASGVSYEDLLKDVSKDQLVVCIPQNDEMYQIIKRRCLDIGVPTQCIEVDTVRKRLTQSVITQIAIQIQNKIGGVPWSVEMPVDMVDVMVVGVSVVQYDTEKETVSLVATLDQKFTKTKTFSAVEKRGCGGSK